MWLKKKCEYSLISKNKCLLEYMVCWEKKIEIKADKMSNMTFWEFLDTPHVFHNEPHMLKNK